MKNLSRILAVYLKIDEGFERERAAALKAGNAANIAKIEETQRLNEQAYFVLCWGQIETKIDEICRNAVKKRRNHPDWRRRRGWDLYNPDDKRLSGLAFDDRAMLVMDKLKHNPEWKLLMRYYAMRNQIAHGRLLANRIYLAQVIEDFYRIQAALSS